MPSSQPTVSNQSTKGEMHFITSIIVERDSEHLYRQSKFAFGGVCLLEQSRQLEYGDFAFLTADGKVLASAVGWSECAHADATQDVWCYQLPYRLTLISTVVHSHVFKRTLLWAKCCHLTTPRHHSIVKLSTKTRNVSNFCSSFIRSAIQFYWTNDYVSAVIFF